MDDASILTKLAAITVGIVAVASGFPLILMLIDAAFNRENCFAIKLWNIIFED